MDINTISIVSLVGFSLIILVIGFKKTLDALTGLNIKLQSNEEKMLTFVEKTNEEIFTKISNELKLVSEHNDKNYKETKFSIEQINQFLEKEIINSMNNLQKEFQNELKIIKNLYEEQFITIAEKIKDESINISKQNEQLTNSIHKDLIESKNSLLNKFEKLAQLSIDSSEIINGNIKEISQNQEKNSINLQTKLNNDFTNIVQLVNNLRLDNLINVSNEIGKYKEGIYEDTHFLQEVGHCKIIRVTDKKSNEITNVYYDDKGEKSYTETFDSDKLKYTMKYENGKLRNGIELDKNGEILFEYIYDDAEEITKKIEYIYNEDTTLKEKKEKNY